MIDDSRRFEKMGALIVNSEAGIVSIVTTILQSMGMTHIERALDGAKAMAMFGEDPNFVSFVVCDWTMPGMTGLQLIEKIRAVNSTIPILILAGDASIENLKAALAAGVSQFIAKPFSAGDLQKRVRAMTKSLAV
ncbi:MAG: response regulator [Rhodospirillaceae bacterium]|nr:response regulator [Rhodospirillaceae bacterium]MBT5837639.1 response regulator [Rhodospirillaceae bacterium]MBT7232181.1 response regulator [Rhodospirillaceae bacterium]